MSGYNMMKRGVVVVGGGITGLSAAALLARAGHDGPTHNPHLIARKFLRTNGTEDSCP